mgnify:CR=1 FL=1
MCYVIKQSTTTLSSLGVKLICKDIMLTINIIEYRYFAVELLHNINMMIKQKYIK